MLDRSVKRFTWNIYGAVGKLENWYGVRASANNPQCRRGLHKRRDNGRGHYREFEDADHVPSH